MVPLLSLPTEILELICEFLASDSLFSLYDLTRVNKRCFAIAARYRFLSIHLNILNRHRLAVDALKWWEILHESQALSAVRALTVRGRMAPSEMPKANALYLDEWVDTGHVQDEMTRLDYFYNQAIESMFYNTPRQQETGWISLIRLLGQLPNLEDFVWACDTLIPPAVLVTVQNIARCKLHVQGLNLPSLHHDVGRLQEASLNDYALATAKCLTSALVPLSRYDIRGIEYNEEAAMQMAAGLAPNLAHLYIAYRPFEIHRFNPGFKARPDWQGFFHDDSNTEAARTQTQIHLQTWSLSPANQQYFYRWASRIALHELKTLHLWETNMETLTAARGTQLFSLKTLALDLLDTGSQYGQVQDIVASSFIANLGASLESVHLSGLPTARITLRTILSHHGLSLKTLSLISPGAERENSLPGPRMTLPRIKLIADSCPILRSLRVAVQRTQSDSNEAALYKALGALPRLKSLFLQLKPYAKRGERWDARNTFINAAVDEVLARSIFRAIVGAGAGELQCVNIVVDHVTPDLGVMAEIVRVMARQWECIRYDGSENVDSLGKGYRVVVKDLDRKRKLFNASLGLGQVRVELGFFEAVYRDIWPMRTIMWEKDWRSFPLQT